MLQSKFYLLMIDHLASDSEGAFSNKRSVIVATGLIALVDDCIKRHFHSKPRARQLTLPLTNLNMEFIGPRAMVSHMFKRRGSGNSSKGGSPLRFANPVTAS